MALTLMVQPGWRDRVAATWRPFPGVVPVLKGNGYGFGRLFLAGLAVELGADEIAVGTIYEIAGLYEAGVNARPVAIVLTPCLPSDVAELGRWPDAVVTIGSDEDLGVLGEVGGPVGSAAKRQVIVKIESSMRRYGVPARDASRLAEQARQAGCEVHGFAIHLPLEQSVDDGLAEARAALAVVSDSSVFYLSHLSAEACAELQHERPLVHIRPRIGTVLWLGDKRHLSLVADVGAVRPVRAGELVGYRQQAVPGDGSIVMVSAGTAQGVQALPDGRSPFHFARHRLALCEPSHMHTSMCFVPAGSPCPVVGDQVDVQQPLTRVQPDRVVGV